MASKTISKEKKNSVHARRFLAYFILILLSVLCLIWFFMLFINTTRSNSQIQTGFSATPSTHFLENWKALMESSIPVWKGLRNSFIIASCSAVLSTYFSTMTAYAIHAYRFKGKNAVFTFILAIMTIPTQVTALGFIQLVNGMKLANNFLPLIVPSIAAPAVFFYIKQYMDSNLSISMLEAARIDGASEFRIFNQIVLPLMKPALSVQLIFTFVTSWNNYFTPALILHKDNMKTLPILIATLRSADYMKFDMGKVYMMIGFSILPVIIVYIFLSKYIVGGVTQGGVKE